MGSQPAWIGHLADRLVAPETDPDGALVYFGPDPSWTPDKEGQPVATIPRVGRKAHHDRANCSTCGGLLGDIDRLDGGRKTCAGCLRVGDPDLEEKLFRAEAAEKARRKRTKEAPADKTDEAERTAEAVRPSGVVKGTIEYSDSAVGADHTRRLRARRKVAKTP